MPPTVTAWVIVPATGAAVGAAVGAAPLPLPLPLPVERRCVKKPFVGVAEIW